MYNLNSGWGPIFADSLAGSAPTAGKVFFVVPTAHKNYQQISDTFGRPDEEGTPRLYATIAAALVACVDNRGDVILVADGYTETIVAAAGSGVTVQGVKIVGLGQGANRPTFTFTTSTAASFDITKNNVTIQNCKFVCGIDAQTAMINVTGADVSFIKCEVVTNSATVGATLGILTGATSDRLVVDGCRFLGPATNSGTTTTAQIQYESAVDILIQNSYFTGKMTQAILNVTGTVLRGLITANNFVIATGTKAIAVAAASTPFITNNRINVPSGTAPIVAAAGFVAGNIYSAAAGVTAGTASTI